MLLVWSALLYATEYSATNLKKSSDFMVMQMNVKCNAEFLKYLVCGPLTWSSNICGFFECYKDDFVYTVPQLLPCLWAFMKGDHCLGHKIAAYAPRTVWSKTSFKHKNTMCFKLKSKPESTDLSPWAETGSVFRECNTGIAFLCSSVMVVDTVLRAVHFPGSDGDLTWLKENYFRNLMKSHQDSLVGFLVVWASWLFT